MTTKEYLRQIRIIDRRIDRKTDEVNRLKEVAVNIGMDMTKERVQTSGTKDRVGNSATAIVDAEKEALRYIGEYLDLRTKIISQINSLKKPSHSDILYLRYVKGLHYKEIAEDLSYSEMHVYRTHSDALAAFEAQFGSTYLES